MRWWEARHQARAHRKAEALRNGAIQDLFALRQRLELLLMATDQAHPEQGETLLRMIEKLSTQLERTGDSLSPPFSEDDLRLALRQAIAQHLQPYPDIIIELNLPSSRLETTTEQIRLLVAAVETVLDLWLQPSLDQESSNPNQLQPVLNVQLSQTVDISQLQLKVTPLRGLFQVADAKKLRRAFCVLGGSCQYDIQSQQMIWTFHWPCSAPAELCLEH